MAKISFDGFEDIEKMLTKEADRARRNGAAALKAGAGIARDAMKEKIGTSDSGHGHSGHLKDHIEISDVSYSRMDGYSVDVYPTGIRDDGQRYATVGFVLEYGKSNKKPMPWMRTAVKAKEKEIQKAMIEELKKDL